MTSSLMPMVKWFLGVLLRVVVDALDHGGGEFLGGEAVLNRPTMVGQRGQRVRLRRAGCACRGRCLHQDGSCDDRIRHRDRVVRPEHRCICGTDDRPAKGSGAKPLSQVKERHAHSELHQELPAGTECGSTMCNSAEPRVADSDWDGIIYAQTGADKELLGILHSAAVSRTACHSQNRDLSWLAGHDNGCGRLRDPGRAHASPISATTSRARVGRSGQGVRPSVNTTTTCGRGRLDSAAAMPTRSPCRRRQPVPPRLRHAAHGLRRHGRVAGDHQHALGVDARCGEDAFDLRQGGVQLRLGHAARGIDDDGNREHRPAHGRCDDVRNAPPPGRDRRSRGSRPCGRSRDAPRTPARGASGTVGSASVWSAQRRQPPGSVPRLWRAL